MPTDKERIKELENQVEELSDLINNLHRDSMMAEGKLGSQHTRLKHAVNCICLRLKFEPWPNWEDYIDSYGR